MKNYILKSQKIVATSNISEISHILRNSQQRTKESLPEQYKDDKNILEPFILSTDGSVMAKINTASSNVGFYYVTGQYVKTLQHVGSPAELADTKFEYLKEADINLLEEVLPSGDLMVYAKGLAHVTDGTENLSELLTRLGISKDEVDKVVYTGLSEQALTPIVLDIDDYFNASSDSFSIVPPDSHVAPGYDDDEVEDEDDFEDEEDEDDDFEDEDEEDEDDEENGVCTFPSCSCVTHCSNFNK